jgi:ribosomal protein L40E
MADTLDVKCPTCGKALKVPAALVGKKVKCKGCDTAFAVAAPKGKPAAKPAAKPGAHAVPAPPPEEPKSPFKDDDDDELDEQGRVKAMGVLKESDAPRCPHCTVELDPPDAVVCYRCGFNNQTRVKAETKKIIAADASDWMSHLGPGIAALLICIALIVTDIVCLIYMSEWLEGSFLEQDEKDILGKKKMWVKPGAFVTLIIGFSFIAILPLGRFAFRRLVLNYKPEEKVKK